MDFRGGIMKIINKRIYTDKQYIELLESRINKAIHLIEHNDITDYRVFENDLLKILKGEDNE